MPGKKSGWGSRWNRSVTGHVPSLQKVLGSELPKSPTKHRSPHQFLFTVFTVATGNAIISLFLVTDRHHDSDMMGSRIRGIGHGGLGCRSYSLLEQKNDKWRPVWGCCHHAPKGSRLRCTPPLSFPSLRKGLAVCKEPLNVLGMSWRTWQTAMGRRIVHTGQFILCGKGEFVTRVEITRFAVFWGGWGEGGGGCGSGSIAARPVLSTFGFFNATAHLPCCWDPPTPQGLDPFRDSDFR